MADLKRRFRRFQLALLFAFAVFLIQLATIFVMFACALMLQNLGIPVLNEAAKIPLFIFSIISLIVGTIIALIFSNRPLKPIREVSDAADRIAAGDYNARVHLKGPDELIQLGERFNHMAQELSSVELLRTDFVNNFSHEFKTPIVSIRGFAKMLKWDDLTDRERAEYLDIIISESDRLAELSSNVLYLSKIEQQTVVTNKRQFNVSEQIRLVIAMMDCKWRGKNISFDFDCAETEILANEELLKQMWINLIDNAIKYSHIGGLVRIHIALEKDSILFSIQDFGRGMTPETTAHVFDKFYQGDASRTDAGNGLGLSIAKRIVELHGGCIRIQSLINSGTTLEVKLPNTVLS